MAKETKTKEEKKQEELERKKRIKEKAKQATLKFEREFRKSVSTAIIGAFSFLIALTWKEVITNAVNKISESTPIKGSLISALIITLISVFGILIVSKLNNEDKKNE